MAGSKAGHIAGFLTNFNGEIIEASVMSLRNDVTKRVTDINGKPLLISGEVEGSPQEQFIYRIKFLSMEHELKEYFFKYHTTDVPNLHYLIGISTVQKDKMEESIER